MSGVFCWIDCFQGKVATISWESLAAARIVADAKGLPLTVLVFGQNVDEIVKSAFANGANRVIKCDDATLAAFRLEPYAALLSKLVADEKPTAVFGPFTIRGRQVLSAAAADSDAPLLDGITAVAVEGDSLKVVRPVYDGKILGHAVSTGSKTVFATVRTPGFAAPVPDPARSGEVVSAAPALSEDQIVSKVTGFAETAGGAVNLSDAKRIVSAGRGVGGPDGMKPVYELAEVIGAAVGASRAVVDSGWMPYSYQIGQTGQTVSPDLYIAVGISGAIQHQAGMRTAKCIVAINKDPDAPIFKLARYGIVGDLFKILPPLTAAFKAKVGK